jgi:hypothetical protein
VGFTLRGSENTFQEMMVAIRDSLSELASSDARKDAKVKDDEIEKGKLNEVDGPCRVMGTIAKTVQLRMECVLEKQRKLDELTQPEWGNPANYVHDREKKYCTTELRVLAVIKP